MGLGDWWAKLRARRLRPGQHCPFSGQYAWSQHPHSQVTSVEGHIMPPPPKGQEGGYWHLTDPTRHKGGQ